MNAGSKTLHWTSDYAPPYVEGTCLGCGWKFHRTQVHFFTQETDIQKHFYQCEWAFNIFTFPATWRTIHDDPNFFLPPPEDISSDDSSMSSLSSSDEEEETSNAAEVPSSSSGTSQVPPPPPAKATSPA